MKPPVTIDQLLDEWEKDAPIDRTEPHKALERIPRLHAKYLTIRKHHRMTLKALELELVSLKKTKSEYYGGTMDQETLEKHNLEPFPQGPLPPRRVEAFVDADEDVLKMQMRMAIQSEIVGHCDDIVSQLNNQNYMLSSIIKWRIFTNDTTIDPDKS